MTGHRGRAAVRPRYGRLTALGSSLAVTLISVLGGVGLLPTASGSSIHHAAPASATLERVGAEPSPSLTPASEPVAGDVVLDPPLDPRLDATLPEDSGTGRRIVFSESRQRVWLVSRGSTVERTYLVSGSIYDNLDPGTYSVYSRSERAWGVDDSGTMRYFVRFTQGDSAAIGFHDIPIDDGEPVQSVDQLGTPLSHGCIRQKRSDAIALWRFAPLGTKVVVTA